MIFISYSSKDTSEVMEWVDFIKTTGLEYWIASEHCDKTKSSWRDSIMDALTKADKVFLYVTESSMSSGEVENEIRVASGRRIPIIPFIAEKVDIPSRIEYDISKYEMLFAYQMEKESARDILRARLFENINETRDRFLEVTQSQDFIRFVREVMKKYYTDAFSTVICGESLPVFTVRASSPIRAKNIRDFDSLCDIDGSLITEFDINEHRGYRACRWYPEYSRILEGKIRYPDRPGYMLDRFITDDNGALEKMQVHVGTYAENVYTTHVLEYELYRAYLEYKDASVDDPTVWQKIYDGMCIRNAIHKGVGLPQDDGFLHKMRASLLTGEGHDTLLSVQMLVIIRSQRTHKYEVKLVQRSQNVAVKPGVYQFVPAGGFEILNDSEDDEYDELELVENLSPGCAVFREYLEEMFNVAEFEGSGTGSVEDRLLKDPRIVKIEQMLKDGRATLSFLGSVMELSGLRHELSFVLVVHDEDYSENRFLANEECKKGKIISIPIDKFDAQDVIWRKLHEPSAAMWTLFKNSEFFGELTESERLEDALC